MHTAMKKMGKALLMVLGLCWLAQATPAAAAPPDPPPHEKKQPEPKEPQPKQG